MRIISALDTVGNALILQLAFLVCALPVVTAVPAAITLQRQLADLRAGERTGPRTFAREFARVWRQSAALGAIGALVAAGFAVAIPFWYSATGPAGRVALAVVVALLGLACGYYLTLLRTADLHRDTAWREWLRPAFAHLALRPLRALWGMAMLGTWLVVLGFVPTLLLVGAGIVPAVIVRVGLGGTEPGGAQASRS